MSSKISVGVLGATGSGGQKSIKLLEDHPWFEVAEIGDLLRNNIGVPQQINLPSAPEKPYIVIDVQDRPQPRFDVNRSKGMATCVRHIRPCSIFDFKLTLMGHNTVRGAAGASILNAELLKAQGLLE